MATKLSRRTVLRICVSNKSQAKFEVDNVNVHRAAAKVLQAEKAARPAAPCATYCYHALSGIVTSQT